jgi:hypothetical protein
MEPLRRRISPIFFFWPFRPEPFPVFIFSP